jgi:hypothetical protein
MRKLKDWVKHTLVATCLVGAAVLSHWQTYGSEVDYGNVTPQVYDSSNNPPPVAYFDSGSYLSAGYYRIEYVSGAMRYTHGVPISIDDPWTPGNGFRILHSESNSNPSGTSILAPGDNALFPTQAEVEEHNQGDSVIFYHAGGKIGMYLVDNPYSDNDDMSGISHNPTFKLVGLPCNKLPVNLTAVGFETETEFQIKVSGPLGVMFDIEWSQDMEEWYALTFQSVEIESGGTIISDTVSSSTHHRFYRVIVPECNTCVGDVVGFVRKTVVPGFTSVANQLINSAGNTLLDILPEVPNDTRLYKWISGAYKDYLFWNGDWYDYETEDLANDITLEPGEGAMLWNPYTTDFRISFVGKVLQGNLQNPIATGLSLKSSMIPQAGLVSKLGLVVPTFSNLQKWNTGTQQFEVYTFAWGEWWDSEPSVEIGEAVFVDAGGPGAWDRVFAPCD